jgi:dihydrolipoamide dehydrogenase
MASVQYDVVVIGSGPGGYVAAIRAGQLGLKTAIVEKDTKHGGTCLLRGCIPTKSLLESAEVFEHALHAREFGIEVGGEPRVDLAGVHRRKAKVVQQNAGGVTFLLKKNKVDLVTGHGSLAGPGRVKVVGPKGEQVLETRHVILAMGSVPRRLPNIEIDGKRVLTSDELLELDEMPRHLLVLGAGAVGVEFASVYRSFGCEVTLVELADRLVPVEDDEVSAEFERVYRKRGINVHTGTNVTGVEVLENGVRASLLGPKGELPPVNASHMLVAVGRRPVTEGCGLESTRIELERGFIKVDGLQRTGEPGVYAIGDIVLGKPQLAHAASNEGIVAVEHIAGLNPPVIDWLQCPGATYSSPEIGSLGLTEREARKRGFNVKVGKFPFSAIGKARILNQTDGFVKIVADAGCHDQILGVHIIGPRATDLIAEAGPLLKNEFTLEELARTIHAHPTLAEAVVEAAHATLGHAIHI